jgi:hypothetical protein
VRMYVRTRESNVRSPAAIAVMTTRSDT